MNTAVNRPQGPWSVRALRPASIGLPLTPAQLTGDNARCWALFASSLQRSDAPGADAVAEAIRVTVQQLGTDGCTGRMAQEFGDHPRGSRRPHALGPVTAAHLALRQSPPTRGRTRRLAAVKPRFVRCPTGGHALSPHEPIPSPPSRNRRGPSPPLFGYGYIA
jgi:hypothetical protein